MRRWRWVADVAHDGDPLIYEEMTDGEILATYYPYFREEMLKAGKAAEISEAACIEDFVVVHWAEEVA